MAETTAKILVPKTVIVKDGTAAELRKVVEQMIDALVANHEVSSDLAMKSKLALYERAPAAELDYPIEEFVETILNTAPQFTGGRTKAQRIAFRIAAAFEGKKAGDVVTLDQTAHDMLKAYFEKPEYTQRDEKGGSKTVEGVVFSPMVWRKCCVYSDAICDGMPPDDKA